MTNDQSSCHPDESLSEMPEDREATAQKDGESKLVIGHRALVIYLIGPRGSGKTTVARLLAERLGWDWVDADAELEARCGRSIREMFASEGEEGFRRHEAEVLRQLSGRASVVIATGGGVVLREDNRELLKRGKVVWLTAD